MIGITKNHINNFRHMLSSRVIVLLSNILIGIFLARQLGSENYGIYAFLISITALLGLPAAIGIPNLVLREIPYILSAEQWNNLKGLLIWSVTSILCLSLVVIILSLIFSSMLDINIIKKNESYFFIALLLLPLLALQTLATNILRGLQFTFSSQIPVYIKQLGYLLLLVLVFLYVPSALNPGTALFVHIVI